MTDDDSQQRREALGKLVSMARRRKFGTVQDALRASGVNRATWLRIEEGQSVREDRLAAAEKALGWTAYTRPRGRTYVNASKLSDPTSTVEHMHELSERDKAILIFSRDWYQFRGNHEAAVREKFDMTTTRFFQEINRIIDDPAAMAFDPFTVKRLQKLRAQRLRSRSARRSG